MHSLLIKKVKKEEFSINGKSYLLILIYSNYSFFIDENKMLFTFHRTTKYAYSPIGNKKTL